MKRKNAKLKIKMPNIIQRGKLSVMYCSCHWKFTAMGRLENPKQLTMEQKVREERSKGENLGIRCL